MSAEWFWLTLLHSPLPLTEGSHNSQCCRNIILSLSLSLSLSCLSPPFRVYSAIVSRTGDQSANSHSHMNEQRAPPCGRPLGTEEGRRDGGTEGWLLVSNNHSSEKMGEQTEARELGAPTCRATHPAMATFATLLGKWPQKIRLNAQTDIPSALRSRSTLHCY